MQRHQRLQAVPKKGLEPQHFQQSVVGESNCLFPELKGRTTTVGQDEAAAD
jgi:hypothetical protein